MLLELSYCLNIVVLYHVMKMNGLLKILSKLTVRMAHPVMIYYNCNDISYLY